MNVTIIDVAKQAKVSPSTVSRVLSNNPRISEKTKEKVMETIRDLNYHPNAIARSLVNSETKILGLIIPSEAEDLLKNPFYIQVMAGISMYSQKKNYYVMYAFNKNMDNELKFIKNYTRSKLVDGIILLKSQSNDICINYLKEINYPFVVIGRPEKYTGVLWVDNDNFQAMYNVVHSLVMKGNKSIAFICAQKQWNVTKDRFHGYKKALKDHGIPYNNRLVVQKENFEEQHGVEAMRELLKFNFDAVVCTDDLLAIGAHKVLKENNVKHISLVGFNNIPLTNYESPQLSSVNINADKLGYCASKLLIDKLTKESVSSDHYIIETNLIERESIRTK